MSIFWGNSQNNYNNSIQDRWPYINLANTIVKLEIGIELHSVTQEWLHNVGQTVLLDSLDIGLAQTSAV